MEPPRFRGFKEICRLLGFMDKSRNDVQFEVRGSHAYFFGNI